MNCKKMLRYALPLLGIPLLVAAGAVVFRDRQYAWISLAVAVLACVPVFLSFERRETATGQLVLLAVLSALSVVGRFVFSLLPHFKPVSAMVILTGLYLGGEAGFLCGALSAVMSNFLFGQGPWTPFQMFAWGVLGLLAGLMAQPLRRHRPLLLVYGALAGALYSCIMDVWTTLQIDGAFNWRRYLMAAVTAAPTTVVYMVSNVIFLLLLAKPIGGILYRLRTKYGWG